MSEIKNLWSSDFLKESELVMPITILHEQAKYFNELTNNILVCEISTKRHALDTNRRNDPKPVILHTLSIVAPAIGNYNFDLVRLVQEEVLPYPVHVYTPITEEQWTVDNSQGLMDMLASIFNDKKTISIIQSLLIQSKE